MKSRREFCAHSPLCALWANSKFLWEKIIIWLIFYIFNVILYIFTIDIIFWYFYHYSLIFEADLSQWWKPLPSKINFWCVLSLIAQTKIFCPRIPISLLHSSHLSCTRRKPHLVGGGVHPAVCGERPKNHDFSKIAGDIPLWKIISRDLLGRFRREYAC